MLGIDIGSHSIKAVEIKDDTVTAFNRIIYPGAMSGSVTGDSVPGTLGSVISGLGSRKQKAAWGSVGGTSVITHLSSYPKMEETELEGAVRLEAEELIFGNRGDNMDFDWEMMERTEEGGYRVLFVAAPADLCDKNIGYFKQAGLYPCGMSVDPLALASSFQVTMARSAQDVKPDSHSVLLDIGARKTNIALFKGNKFAALRVVDFGGEDITKAVMNGFKMSFTEAENLKRSPTEAGKDEEKLTDTIKKSLQPFFRQLAITLGRKNQSGGDVSFMLAGGGSFTPGMLAMLEEKFGVSAGFYNPFKGINTSCTLPDQEKLLSIYAISLGCAFIGSKDYER